MKTRSQAVEVHWRHSNGFGMSGSQNAQSGSRCSHPAVPESPHDGTSLSDFSGGGSSSPAGIRTRAIEATVHGLATSDSLPPDQAALTPVLSTVSRHLELREGFLQNILQVTRAV